MELPDLVGQFRDDVKQIAVNDQETAPIDRVVDDVFNYFDTAKVRPIELAQEIIVMQHEEIAAMRLAIGQPLPSAPSPDQKPPAASPDGHPTFSPMNVHPGL